MLDPVFARNSTLGSRLAELVLENGRSVPADGPFDVVSTTGADRDSHAHVSVVVTANEVTDLHGTGPLVKRVCQDWRNVFSIRARNDWGIQDFGDWHVCLTARNRTRSEYFHNALSVLRGRNVRRILCVPFLPDEFYTSIAIQECFGAKLCVYMMDDQNVATHNIPDTLMEEFLRRCSFRVATHPELQTAYESKFRLPFHVLPAIVPASVIPPDMVPPPPARKGRNGALIGSFWDQSWYDHLCTVIGACNCHIDWFGNNKSPWLDLSPKKLAKAGIKAHGLIPEPQLGQELQKYPFVIVPVGALDGTESNVGVAQLSLPGRILFALASSNTPVLIIGSRNTCAARFVSHFGVGEVVPYEAGAVAAAMDRMSAPDAQVRMRQAAAKIAPALSDAGISTWLSESIELGRPADSRFEDLFAGYDANMGLGHFTLAAAGSH